MKKVRVSGEVYAKFVASLYNVPGHTVEESHETEVLTDYVDGVMVAQVDEREEPIAYWIFTNVGEAVRGD